VCLPRVDTGSHARFRLNVQWHRSDSIPPWPPFIQCCLPLTPARDRLPADPARRTHTHTHPHAHTHADAPARDRLPDDPARIDNRGAIRRTARALDCRGDPGCDDAGCAGIYSIPSSTINSAADTLFEYFDLSERGGVFFLLRLYAQLACSTAEATLAATTQAAQVYILRFRCLESA
jgi:hypothetical protein